MRCAMYESDCAFLPRRLGPILCGKWCYLQYSIASYEFFCNTPPCYIINQQQWQWAAHLVLSVANTYLNVEAEIVLLREATVHGAICVT